MCRAAGVGYQPHEPHGYSPVTTQTVVQVTEDRAGRGRVRARLLTRGSAVFACGVHPPVTGSLTPGYVLCCSVRDDAAHRSQPDGAAGGMRPGEGDVTGAIAPTKPLNALDL